MIELTREEMIDALRFSLSEDVAKVCGQIHDQILTGKELERYHNMCGGFMKAVLNGNFKVAFNRADTHNKICLDEAVKIKTASFIRRYSE